MKTLTAKKLVLIQSIVLGLAAATDPLTSNDVSGQDLPNVILIMADDVGMECFESYGESEYKTPNLTFIAKRGLRFTQCYSTPLCTPSRVKLMTGKYNVRNYHDFSILPPGEKTFAHGFKKAGYQTAVAGKWQLYGAKHYGDMAGKGTRPGDAGFDEYCLWQVETLGARFWKPLLDINGELKKGTEDEYGPDLCTDFICDFIERNKKQPFFVYYPMILAHNPFVPTPHSQDRNSKDKKQNFVDMVEYMDHLVGRIFQQTKKSKVSNRTLILFLTDNGTNRNITSTVKTTKVQGGKGLTNLRGTHSPLIAYWPSQVEPARFCDDLIDLTDFHATFAELAKFDAKGLNGVSFAAQLVGTPIKQRREAIYCYYHPRPTRKNFPGPITYAHNQRWKLYRDGRLYNLENDPEETKPIDPKSDNWEANENRGKLKKFIESQPATGQNLNSAKAKSSK